MRRVKWPTTSSTLVKKVICHKVTGEIVAKPRINMFEPSKPMNLQMQDDFMHPTEMVHACIRDNNIFKLRVLLQSHPTPDFNRLSNWGTPLHVAVHCNSLVAVEMLLQAGADPIIDSDIEQTEWGDFLTPLSLAA